MILSGRSSFRSVLSCIPALLVVPALAVLLLPAVLPAQAVQGRVVDAEAGRPAAGAIVSLVQADGRRVAPALVGPDGAYLVSAPAPGSFRLRVDLIGHEAWLSPPLALGPRDTLALDVRLPLRRVELAAVTVQGESRCEARPDQVPRTLALWEEIRRALTLAGLAEQRRLPFELRVIERLVRAQGTVGNARRSQVRSEVVRPWSTAPPALVAEQGWVVWEGDSLTFHGPSIDALLSEEFLATHCFTPVRRQARGQSLIGLAFAPLEERTLPDIAGTIWLDERSSELRTVEFTYQRTTDSLSTGEPPGGTLEFDRLPSGLWYIQRWTLRLPTAAGGREATDGSSRRRRHTDPSRWQYIPYRELVGEAVALERDGRADRSAIATVSGAVVDSTSGAPLEGVWVLVPGEPMVRTDSAGRYALEVHDVPKGDTEYLIGFEHPYFDGLGLPNTSRQARLRGGGAVRVDFAVPPLASLMRTVCPALAPGSAGRTTADARQFGLVAGRLRTATGAPLPDSVHIHVEWMEAASVTPRARAGAMGPDPVVTLRPDGQFLICPLPLARPILLQALHDGRVAASARFALPATGVGWQDLLLDAPGGR